MYPYKFQEAVTYYEQAIRVKETVYGPRVIGVEYQVKGKPVPIKSAIYRYKDK